MSGSYYSIGPEGEDPQLTNALIRLPVLPKVIHSLADARPEEVDEKHHGRQSSGDNEVDVPPGRENRFPFLRVPVEESHRHESLQLLRQQIGVLKKWKRNIGRDSPLRMWLAERPLSGQLCPSSCPPLVWQYSRFPGIFKLFISTISPLDKRVSAQQKTKESKSQEKQEEREGR